MSLPNLSWVRSTLRNSLYAPLRLQVLAAYVIGSEARGSAKGSSSDLDIAVVIPEIRGKTALQFTEHYHNRFPNDAAKPVWEDRRVDFQFF